MLDYSVLPYYIPTPKNLIIAFDEFLALQEEKDHLKHWTKLPR